MRRERLQRRLIGVPASLAVLRCRPHGIRSLVDAPPHDDDVAAALLDVEWYTFDPEQSKKQKINFCFFGVGGAEE